MQHSVAPALTDTSVAFNLKNIVIQAFLIPDLIYQELVQALVQR